MRSGIYGPCCGNLWCSNASLLHRRSLLVVYPLQTVCILLDRDLDWRSYALALL